MNEKLSALMDGELEPDASASLISALKHDETAHAKWSAYHLIGDAMRGEPRLANDMTGAISRQLLNEPTVLAPKRKAPAFVGRHAMPLAASLAAIGFVGFAAWQTIRVSPPAGAAVQIAQTASPQALVADNAAPRSRPAQVPSSYLLAHQEFSPSYAVESAPMLARTVSLQREDAGR